MAFRQTARKLRSGDIINIDVTVIKDGWHGDTSIMVGVGDVAPHADRLMRVTQECLYQALALVKPGAALGDLGACDSTACRGQLLFSGAGSTVGTVLGRFFMRNHRYCIMGGRAPGCVWSRA